MAFRLVSDVRAGFGVLNQRLNERGSEAWGKPFIRGLNRRM
jgi:hypothetical protein